MSRCSLIVGRINKAERHPDADALYVEEIDLGEEKPRTIISGLVKHIPIEEMQGRMVVCITNLKPAKCVARTSFFCPCVLHRSCPLVVGVLCLLSSCHFLLSFWHPGTNRLGRGEAAHILSLVLSLLPVGSKCPSSLLSHLVGSLAVPSAWCLVSSCHSFFTPSRHS